MAKLGNLIGRGATTDKPAAGIAGRLYFDTDLGKLQRDNGSTWQDVSESTTSGAPSDATYVVEDANGSLSAESVLGTTVITKNDHASRQAAAKAGRLFLSTDGYTLNRDNGSGWDSWGPVFPFTLPDLNAFTWVNQGSATAMDEKDGIYLTTPANGGTDCKILKKAAPSVPFTITVALLPLLYLADYSAVLVGFRQSSDGKLAALRYCYISGHPSLVVDKWNSPTSWSANYTLFTATSALVGPIFWLRIADDNVNRIVSYSVDGQHFVPLHSVARTDFLTADEVFFGVNAQNIYQATALKLLHWKEA